MADKPDPKKDEIKADADNTLGRAGGGGNEGYQALMQDFTRAEGKYGINSDNLKAYTDNVLKGMAPEQISNYAEIWGKQNFDRLDSLQRDKVLSRGEVSPDKAQNPLEAAFLKNISERYSALQNDPWYKDKSGRLKEGDFDKALENRAKGRDANQVKEHRADKETAANAEVQNMTGALLNNNGDPSKSLFNRLVALEDGKPDDSFSRSAVQKYLNLASAQPEGSPGFSKEEVNTASALYNNWDSPAVKLMRGERANSNHGHDNQPEYNHNIDLSRLAKNLGTNPDALYAANSPEGRQRQAQARQGNVQEVQYTGEPQPVDGSGVGEIRRNRPEYRPVPQASGNDGVAEVRQRPTRPGQDVSGEEAVNRRRQEQQTEAPKPKPVEVRQDPKVPDFQGDADDATIAKTREAYAQELAKVYQERSFQNVNPGDGWDRIARRELRQSGADASESNVVKFSDSIAKLNGWTGRLDADKMLMKGQQPVRVRPEGWAEEQVKAKLAEFDAEVVKRKEAAAKAKAEAEAAKPPVDQFQDQRNNPNPSDSTAAVGTSPDGTGDAAVAERVQQQQNEKARLEAQAKAGGETVKTGDGTPLTDSSGNPVTTGTEAERLQQQQAAEKAALDQKAADDKAAAEKKAAQEKAAAQDKAAAEAKIASDKAALEAAQARGKTGTTDTAQIPAPGADFDVTGFSPA
ncbi:MAG: hypothetical protein HY986_06315 [Candidatus Melainabacteria bacterium]|nr:hypothetical protein [Candidatus Melainabacteria bacterium]